MTEDVLLAACKITRSYARHRALRGIDVSLRRGEILGFLGLNGAGKSTTMQILAGALPADSGKVSICGYDLAREPQLARRALGYLPQTPPLYDDMLVDEFLHMSASIRGMTRGEIAGAVARARGDCGLNEVGKRLIRHLSGGYRQRLGLAQAIVHEPRVLILDEPTTGLDPAQIRDVRTLIREFSAERAVMVSTHVLAEVRAFANRVMILHNGIVVHDDAVDTGEHTLKVRFEHNPQADALSAVLGVVSAEYDVEDFWLLKTEAASVATTVAAHAVAAGWGIVELIPDYVALEHLFLRLTAGEALSLQV